MRLYLGGYLGFYNPQHGNWLDVELNQQSKLYEVLTELSIPLSDLHLVVLNGELVDINEAVVNEGDEVKLFPAIGGGK